MENIGCLTITDYKEVLEDDLIVSWRCVVTSKPALITLVCCEASSAFSSVFSEAESSIMQNLLVKPLSRRI
eukprot:4270297-Pyramimonas_sp.AAC.1